MLTERENYLRAIKGGQPEWVPVLAEAVDVIRPRFLLGFLETEDKVDMFGVKWEITSLAPIESPNTERIEDISLWRDRVKLPDLSAIDWEKEAALDLKNHSEDKLLSYWAMGPSGLMFVPLMGMMGFEDGLCSLISDPEEVMAFNETMAQFWIEVVRKVLEYYKPDIIVLGDDVASAKDLFMSPSLFRKLYLPYYKQIFDVCREAGVHIEFHLCGQAESIIDDLVEIGMGTWQVAQCTNDLLAIQKKHPELPYAGVWDTLGPGVIPGTPEDIVRQTVRDCMDVYGQTGRLIFLAGGFAPTEDGKRQMGWVMDEAHKYGRTLYQKQ